MTATTNDGNSTERQALAYFIDSDEIDDSDD